MHQRQASSYGRKFIYGKHQPPRDLTPIWDAPGIGLVPPEFDDLRGGEVEAREEIAAHGLAPS